MHLIAESNVVTKILKESKEIMDLSSNVKVPPFPVRPMVCLSRNLILKNMVYI